MCHGCVGPVTAQRKLRFELARAINDAGLTDQRDNDKIAGAFGTIGDRVDIAEDLMDPWLVFLSRLKAAVDEEEDSRRKRGLSRLG